MAARQRAGTESTTVADPMPPTKSSSSPSSVEDISDAAAAAALSRPAAYRVTSSLLTQDAVDALCKKHGVPKAYAARPAGDRRACMRPPERAVCMYAHALEAGVRFPLHSFFSEALTHFRLAPGQLAPSAWRVLVGFVALCRDAGVQPSMDVFLYFFSLVAFHDKCWYGFKAKQNVRALLTGTGLATSDNKEWKGRFFFLASPEPWTCPMRWGEPPLMYKYPLSGPDPVLTSQQKKTVSKLLEARGGAVNPRTYLSDDAQLAAAAGMDSPPAAKVKPEPDVDALALSLKKRKHEEAAAVKDGLCRTGQSTPHAAHGCSASASGLGAPPPPGVDPKPYHSPVHGGDSADWEAARKVLESITTPSREHAFAAAKPSDVVASSYSAMLQAANYASFSFGYAQELEKKLVARDAETAAMRKKLESAKAELTTAKRAAEVEAEKKLAALDKENAALRVQLESAKAELTTAKRAAEAEVESAKKTAVQQFLASEEYARCLAEHGLMEYKRGAEETKRAALQHLELHL